MPGRTRQAYDHERAEEVEAAKDEESAPLLEKSKAKAKPESSIAVKAFWAIMVITCSAGLINYNNYLMTDGGFPFPVVLVMMHSFFGTILAGLLLIFCPFLFPALTDPEQKISLDVSFICRRALPVGVTFGASLVLSNTAYEYASVAFLQMVKQSNVITVYVLSLIAGLERYRTRLVVVLLCIMIATSATITGELNFSLAGLMIQLACCMMECIKVVLQGILLSGSGRKLDPLSFVLIISPLCFFCLLALLMVHLLITPMSWITIPLAADFARCKWLLVGNVLTAFSLNIVVANFLKHGTPMSFLVTNLVKDATIVIASAVLVSEEVSHLQAAGFVAQLFFIFVWSAMQTFPQRFENNESTLHVLLAVLQGKAAKC